MNAYLGGSVKSTIPEPSKPPRKPPLCGTPNTGVGIMREPRSLQCPPPSLLTSAKFSESAPKKGSRKVPEKNPSNQALQSNQALPPSTLPFGKNFRELCTTFREIRKDKRPFALNLQIVELEKSLGEGDVSHGVVLAMAQTSTGTVSTGLYCPDFSQIHSAIDLATRRVIELAFDSTSGIIT